MSQIRSSAPLAGTPQTPGDFRELAKLSEERQQAVAALARATGKQVSNVAANMRREVSAVLVTAHADAIRHGTTIEAEVDRVAEWCAKRAHEAEKKSAALSTAGKNRWAREKAEQAQRAAEFPKAQLTQHTTEKKARLSQHIVKFQEIEKTITTARNALSFWVTRPAEDFSAQETEVLRGRLAELRTAVDKIEAHIEFGAPAGGPNAP
jgi:hypothetical protein